MSESDGTVPRVAALRALVGHERSLRLLPRTLHASASAFEVGTAGAMHVTCADEAEYECLEAFERGFVRGMLPALELARPAPFRLATLGGRYEWGAVRVGEGNFATPDPLERPKLFVVKLNAHVAVEPIVPAESAGPRDASSETSSATVPFTFGSWQRYGRPSACCGALNALLHGSHGPFAEELRETFMSEGLDRLGPLQDARQVAPALRALYAALVSTRLQARKVVLDIQDYRPLTPTIFLVLPCVSLNRHGRDTEILCGIYTVDSRPETPEVTYEGLGDDPSLYRCGLEARRRIHVHDPHVGNERKGRDHRALVRDRWRARMQEQLSAIRDERLQRIREDASRIRKQDVTRHHAKALLRAALSLLGELAPIPVAVQLFADGVVGIHHVFRVQKLASESEGSETARQILGEIHEQIDTLRPEQAAATLSLLTRDYR